VARLERGQSSPIEPGDEFADGVARAAARQVRRLRVRAPGGDRQQRLGARNTTGGLALRTTEVLQDGVVLGGEGT